jgi:hypothetical protein
MNNNLPLEFRAGSAGMGLFAGCGAGVGILTPVSLHSIPVIGQIAGSVATSLRQLDSTFGNFGWRITSTLNSKAKPLGLRAGTGCGVALGYGWGVGFMLKPTALASLSEAIKSKIPPSIAGKLDQAKGQANLSTSTTLRSTLSEQEDISSRLVTEATAPKTPPVVVPNSATNTSAELEKDVAALTKLVLQQQLALQKVNEKVESLQLELSQQTTRNKM